MNLTLFDYTDETSIIIDEGILSPDYIPPVLHGRDEQMKEVAYLFKPLFLNGPATNCLIFGPPGSGKTVVTKYVLKSLVEKIKDDKTVLEALTLKQKELHDKNLELEEIELKRLNNLKKNVPDINIQWAYVHCKKYHTTSSILYYLITTLDQNNNTPRKGVPLDVYYNKLFNIMKTKNAAIILILDEIDFLQSDNVLYNFSRAVANEEITGRQFISVIGLSNSVKFEESLDPRVLSSAGFDKLNFPHYNAENIINILQDRVELAFASNSIEIDTIAHCAKDSAKAEGDVRKAIKVLKTAAKFAEKRGSTVVIIEDLHTAQDEVQKNQLYENVLLLSDRHKLVLLAIIKMLDYRESATTGQVTKIYDMMCPRIDLDIRDRKVVSNAVTALEMQSLIETDTVHRGRRKGGTTRVITIFKEDKKDIIRAIFQDKLFKEELDLYDPIDENKSILND
jgi:archaeal cell division control protein 6